MLRPGALILALLLLAPMVSGEASDKTVLIEFDLKSGAQPLSVSAGGAVVVGGLSTGGGFYWMPTTGVIFAGGLFASRVSRDGKVIVGQAIEARLRQAAIWQRGAEWRSLGSFPNAQPCDTFLSLANGTSGDGKVVVGYANNGCTLTHAFRWEESTGMVDLGTTVAGKGTFALGVSADGQVAVGYQEQATGFLEGAKWVGTRQERVPGPDGFVSVANAANVDASIIVGRICRPAANRPKRPGLSKRVGLDARRHTVLAPAETARIPRSVDHRRSQRDERRRQRDRWRAGGCELAGFRRNHLDRSQAGLLERVPAGQRRA